MQAAVTVPGINIANTIEGVAGRLQAHITINTYNMYPSLTSGANANGTANPRMTYPVRFFVDWSETGTGFPITPDWTVTGYYSGPEASPVGAAGLSITDHGRDLLLGHMFQAPGSYNITIKAEDMAGVVQVASVLVKVSC